MAVVDKNYKLADSLTRGCVRLELGCGERKRDASAIGVDCLDTEQTDVIADIYELLDCLPDCSVESITSHHCFEHLPDLARLVNQIARVLKPAGRCEFVVPHFSNPYFASDATHRTPFGLYTMSYFADDSIFRRRVPTYQRALRLRLEDVQLEFKSCRPFYARFAVKRFFSFLVNRSRYFQEFYEENLVGIFPCYELRFRLSKME